MPINTSINVIDNPDQFRKRLKNRLKELNLTIYQLAKHTYITYSSLKRIVSGVHLPTPPVIYCISSALRVRFEWLARGESPKELMDEMGLKDDEKEILKMYNRLPKNSKQLLLSQLRSWNKMSKPS